MENILWQTLAEFICSSAADISGDSYTGVQRIFYPELEFRRRRSRPNSGRLGNPSERSFFLTRGWPISQISAAPPSVPVVA